MRIIALLASLVLIFAALVDGFETILQPRRIMHGYRFARLFYRSSWRIWRATATRIPLARYRQAFISTFGPLSLIGLFATWVAALIFGFGLLHWSIRSPLHGLDTSVTFLTYLYLSGTTFFTLGYGDVTPVGMIGRTLAVIESGMGFAVLAILIGYLPVLYQAFSRRELTTSLLDARAGSPPSAGEFLVRLARSGNFAAIDRFLAEWETWAAELLESHLSFPVLSYFRSQHDNQSWLATLTTVLDATAVLLVTAKAKQTYQAQLTFAMARHAAVDLALVLNASPQAADQDRAPAGQYQQLIARLREAGIDLPDRPQAIAKLAELRAMYEPVLNALARRFLLVLPPLLPDQPVPDNWQRSSWMPRTPGIGSLPAAYSDDEHFG